MKKTSPKKLSKSVINAKKTSNAKKASVENPKSSPSKNRTSFSIKKPVTIASVIKNSTFKVIPKTPKEMRTKADITIAAGKVTAKTAPATGKTAPIAKATSGKTIPIAKEIAIASKSKAKATATATSSANSKETAKKGKNSSAVKAVKSAATKVKEAVINNIDASLLKLSPNMQKTLDTIVNKIEQTPVHIEDLRALACRVLKHANEINQNLKQKITSKPLKVKS
jgi:hypothetical protein